MNKNQLKDFVEQNRKELDNYPLPDGDSELFQARIAESNHSAGRLRTAILIPAAALICAIVLFIIIPNRDKREEITTIEPEYLSVKECETRYIKDLEQIASQIISQSQEIYPNNTFEIEESLNRITHDAIYMYQQLPYELSEEEQLRIIKDYYEQKKKGLEQFKLFITQNQE